MSQKEEKIHRYIEDMAMSFEEKGFPRMAGRIMAWLMIADPSHQTMPELVDALQASKSSISTATRLLINFQLVEKISMRGERKDYYRLKPDIWKDSIQMAVKKMTDFKQIAFHSLEVLSDVDIRKDKLEEMYDVYAFMESQMPLILENWEKQKNKKK
ncbi:MAG: GbsR/MarR family transcriptional regulator [Cyclobacteriaceae bacterium]